MHSLTLACVDADMLEGLSLALEFDKDVAVTEDVLEAAKSLLKDIDEMPADPWAPPLPKSTKKTKKKNQELQQLQQQYSQLARRTSSESIVVRTLLYAHLYRLHMRPELLEPLDAVLKLAPSLLNVLGELAFRQGSVRNLRLVLSLSQMLVQAVPQNDLTGQFEQLPHVTKSMLDQLDKNKIKSMNALVQQSDEAVERILSKANTPDTHISEVIDFLNVFPTVEVAWDMPGLLCVSVCVCVCV